jgi:lsr operon transcriptional repressor
MIWSRANMAVDRFQSASSSHPARAACQIDLELVGNVAQLHFLHGLSHREIGSAYRLELATVDWLLQQARELGIVRVEVTTAASPFAELERSLVATFGLREALVVPFLDDPERLRATFAHAADRYLRRTVADGSTVARALGRTGSADPLDRIAGAIDYHRYAPAIVASESAAGAIRADPAIARRLRRVGQAAAALIEIDAMHDRGDHVDDGSISVGEWDELVACGAVGDIAGRFVGADGSPIDHAVDRRVVGLTLDELRQVPLRVVTAGGADGDLVVLAALMSGIVSVLVTDSGTAARVLAAGAVRPHTPEGAVA